MHKDNLIYLEKYNTEIFLKMNTSPDFLDFFLKFLTFLVAYSHLIPISLYVALEIVKMIQTIFILYDEKCIDPVSKKPAIARTSDLIEELGQVEFIFTDKTGTLTKNEMVFRKCFINNVSYGENEITELNSNNSNNLLNNSNSNYINTNIKGNNCRESKENTDTIVNKLIGKPQNDKEIGSESYYNHPYSNEICNISSNVMFNSFSLSDKEKNTKNISNHNIFGVNGDIKPYNILTGKCKEVNKNDKIYIEDFFNILSVCHSAYIDYKKDEKIFQVKYFKN